MSVESIPEDGTFKTHGTVVTVFLKAADDL